MKRYDELTPEEKKKALETIFSHLLEKIVSGEIRFNDEANQDDLQDNIEKAIDEANKMQTPWFAGEYILDAEFTEDGQKRSIRDFLIDMSKNRAEEVLYSEPEECVICGIVSNKMCDVWNYI